MRAGSTQGAAEAPGAQTIDSKYIIIPKRLLKMYLVHYCVHSLRFHPIFATCQVQQTCLMQTAALIHAAL